MSSKAAISADNDEAMLFRSCFPKSHNPAFPLDLCRVEAAAISGSIPIPGSNPPCPESWNFQLLYLFVIRLTPELLKKGISCSMLHYERGSSSHVDAKVLTRTSKENAYSSSPLPQSAQITFMGK